MALRRIRADSAPRLPCNIGIDVLSADLSNLAANCKKFLSCGADFLHFDIMDGQFTYDLSFGHHFVKALRDALGPDAYLDVHVMTTDPLQWLDSMANAGANRFTFNLEAFKSGVTTSNTLEKIGRMGMDSGLAILPQTPVGALLPFCDSIDAAVIMTVDPKNEEQVFIPTMMGKIKKIRSLYPELTIQVDGDVGPTNVDLCAYAGANSIVAGSAVSSHPEPEEVMETMYQHMRKDLRAREKSYSFTEYFKVEEEHYTEDTEHL